MILSFSRRQFCSTFAAIVHRKNQIVVIVVVSAPQHALIALILKSLRRHIDLLLQLWR